MSELMGLPAQMKIVQDRLTATRAGYLDDLPTINGLAPPSANSLGRSVVDELATSLVGWAYLNEDVATGASYVTVDGALSYSGVCSALCLSLTSADTNVTWDYQVLVNGSAALTGSILCADESDGIVLVGSACMVDSGVPLYSITPEPFFFSDSLEVKVRQDDTASAQCTVHMIVRRV